jgi:hypothetical protein
MILIRLICHEYMSLVDKGSDHFVYVCNNAQSTISPSLAELKNRKDQIHHYDEMIEGYKYQ